jgi:hypothetical protein
MAEAKADSGSNSVVTSQPVVSMAGNGASVTVTDFLGTGLSLPVFNINKDPSVVANEWKKWKRSFNLFLRSRSVTDNSLKQAWLLHHAGMAVQEIYYTLSKDQDLAYADSVKLLDDYFLPMANVPFERHQFRQLCQTADETVAQFVCRLRQSASTCDFGETESDAIRDQVIDKCRSINLRRKLLERDKLSLDDVLKVANAYEAVDRQLKAFTPPSNVQSGATASVHAVRGSQSSRGRGTHQSFQHRGVQCYACGRHGHMSSDASCPAKGKTCSYCCEVGHFKQKCPKAYQDRKKQQPGKPKSNSGNRHFKKDKREKGKVNQLDEDYSSDDGYTFAVDTGSTKSGTIDLTIGGVKLSDVLIDSGANRNVIGKSTWEYLKEKGIKCKSKKATQKVYPYLSEPLELLGLFDTIVECPVTGISAKMQFVVTAKDGRSLLGRESSESLGVLRVGPSSSQPCVNVVAPEISTITEKFSDLFCDKVGLLRDYQLKLHIDDSVRPVAQPVRRIPFGLRDKVNRKLDQLLADDIIEEVPEGPTGWVSPLVVIPKGDDVRICVDMRRANCAIVRERHPIPAIDDLLVDLNQATVFSKIDLKMGFHQVELEPESRHITTFVTHRGLYRYRRLMFGISSAPEKYQRLISDVIRGDGVANIADDIIVFGRNETEHNERLTNVLTKLQNAGLTVNKKKCEFGLKSLTFFGHQLTSNGISPSDEKIEAIVRAEPPTCASELRSFLGLVQFCARFIPDLSTVAEPLQRLCRKNTKFIWGAEQQSAFKKLKKCMSSAQTLAYFQTDAKTRVIADASPFALGAVLTQWQSDGTPGWRVVSYASRGLTDVERRYSQTEKEALALVWACERFRLYLYGLPFELETDHRPLQYIFQAKSRPAARVERWVLRLQAFEFNVVYRPGKSNIADCLSRLNKKPNCEKGETFDDLCNLVEVTVPCAITVSDFNAASKVDEEIRMLCDCIQTGNWNESPKCISNYLPMKNELCVCGDMVLRGTRLVVPEKLRKTVLQLAHEGHQGIVKTKTRLRSKVWWPSMDKQAEKFCKSCYECQLVSQNTLPEPMARSLPPDGPWQMCAADLLGPMPTGESLLVIVDYYSRYFEAVIMRSTTSEKVVAALTQIFARFGVPQSLKTDNGPQFVSGIFTKFLNEYGITHLTSPPLWPQANGEVERQNRSILKALRIAHSQNRNWREDMQTYLLAYRSTPHASTGSSPFRLMFGREMRTKLPELCADNRVMDQEFLDNDWKNKIASKTYSDKRRNATVDPVDIGDMVLLKANKTDKLSTNFEKTPCRVVNREGGEITVRRPDGSQVRRHTTAVKRLTFPDEDILLSGDTVPHNAIVNNDSDIGQNERSVDTQQNETSVADRPKRSAGMPAKFQDFVVPDKFKK